MDHGDWLYAIGHPDGFYKVGFTANLEQRFQALECSSPYFLRPAFACHVTDKIQALERKVHQVLGDRYVCNEWFDCPLPLIIDQIHVQCDALGIGIVVMLQPFPIFDRPGRRRRPKMIKPSPYSLAGMQLRSAAA